MESDDNLWITFWNKNLLIPRKRAIAMDTAEKVFHMSTVDNLVDNKCSIVENRRKTGFLAVEILLCKKCKTYYQVYINAKEILQTTAPQSLASRSPWIIFVRGHSEDLPPAASL